MELRVGKRMRWGSYSGVAHNGRSAPERENGGGRDQDRVESRDVRWFRKRVCEKGRAEEDGERADGRRERERGKEEGE